MVGEHIRVRNCDIFFGHDVNAPRALSDLSTPLRAEIPCVPVTFYLGIASYLLE